MDENQNTQWHGDRQKVITASDMLFILIHFGSDEIKKILQDYKTYDRTKYQLYNEKRMPLDKYLKYQDAIKTPIMQEGKDKESEIAEHAKTDLGLRRMTPNGDNLYTLDEHKIGATPDYIIHEICIDTIQTRLGEDSDKIKVEYEDIYGLGNGILECKLTREIDEKKILGYKLQVQTQLLCTGAKWGIIAIAEKESWGVESEIARKEYHFIKANSGLQQRIIEAVQKFWEWVESIDNGIIDAPQPDFDNKRDKALYKEIIGEETNDPELCELALQWHQAQEDYKLYKHAEDTFELIKGKIRERFGTEFVNLTVNVTDGSKYKIVQNKSKQTLWTEETKKEAIKIANEIEVGSVKTESRITFDIKNLDI